MSLLAISTLVLACCAGGALSTGDVRVTTLGQNGTQAEGAAALAANGTLTPFGDVGLGCGINWKEDSSFGGGLQAGSSSLGLGLGGGWTIAPDHMTVGVGAGLPHVNASVALTLDYDGAAEFKITSSGPLTCTPSRDAAGANVMTCKSG